MDNCMCASIINLHRLKPCNRSDIHCNILSSSASLSSWSLVCTFMHSIRYRWVLLCVVVQYDLKEKQIKFSSGVSVSISCNFKIKFNSVTLTNAVIIDLVLIIC